MALWGDRDNISVGTGATAYIDSYTKDEALGGYPVIGAGSVWGSSGYAQIGDVIHFGASPSAGPNNPATGAGGTYYGSAVISNISGVAACYIASTEGILSGWAADAGVATVFTISQSPKFAIGQQQWSVRNTDARQYVAGVSTGGVTNAAETQYETGVGWVGVQTYVDADSNLRVKKEVLVAMSGITTGNQPIYDSNPTA